jgi:hypothetical protein
VGTGVRHHGVRLMDRPDRQAGLANPKSINSDRTVDLRPAKEPVNLKHGNEFRRRTSRDSHPRGRCGFVPESS